MRRLSTIQADFGERLAALLAFETAADAKIDDDVRDILAQLKARGDEALLEYSRRFDRVSAQAVSELEIGREACEHALSGLPTAQREALIAAAERVRAYHEHQLAQSWSYHDAEGNELGQRVTALDRVGVYVSTLR